MAGLHQIPLHPSCGKTVTKMYGMTTLQKVQTWLDSRRVSPIYVPTEPG